MSISDSEHEALVRDARRYRWLRTVKREPSLPHIHWADPDIPDECILGFGEFLDEVVDSAMATHGERK